MEVKSIWRYPVKSMGGESLQESGLSLRGVIGDRCYAIHDGDAIRGAKRFGSLMDFSASYLTEPDGIEIPEVALSRGKHRYSSSDDSTHAFLSRELGQTVTLDKLRPIDDLDYYQSAPDIPSLEEIQQILGIEEGESMPDFSEFPPELFSYATPPGTFFDAFPLLILTSSSLQALQDRCPDSNIDERRFRPNIVIDSSELETAFIEESWKARYLSVGETVIQLTLGCPRCVMTTIGFDNLPKDTNIMRQLVKANHHKLGIYGRVFKPGRIRIGDQVTVSKDEPK